MRSVAPLLKLPAVCAMAMKPSSSQLAGELDADHVNVAAVFEGAARHEVVRSIARWIYFANLTFCENASRACRLK